MVELLEEHNLSICSLGVGGVLESVEDFLDGDDFFGAEVDGFPDVAVCALAVLFDELVAG